MLKQDGQWQEVSWEVALQAAARGLKAAGHNLGTLIHPSSTTEEAYLAAKLTRALGSSNVDHRLRQRDFRDAAADALQPALGMPIAEVDAVSGALVIGSNLRGELPLLAHRLRKAAVKAGAKVAFIDSVAREYRFPVAIRLCCAALCRPASSVRLPRPCWRVRSESFGSVLSRRVIPRGLICARWLSRSRVSHLQQWVYWPKVVMLPVRPSPVRCRIVLRADRQRPR
jgi:hypothetical protein